MKKVGVIKRLRRVGKIVPLRRLKGENLGSASKSKTEV